MTEKLLTGTLSLNTNKQTNNYDYERLNAELNEDFFMIIMLL